MDTLNPALSSSLAGAAGRDHHSMVSEGFWAGGVRRYNSRVWDWPEADAVRDPDVSSSEIHCVNRGSGRPPSSTQMKSQLDRTAPARRNRQ